MAKRGYGQRQRTEDAEEQVEHGKEAPQTLGGIQHGEGAEAHALNGVLHLRDLGGIFGTYGQRHVGLAPPRSELRMSLNSAMFSFSVRSTGRKIRPRDTVRMPP